MKKLIIVPVLFLLLSVCMAASTDNKTLTLIERQDYFEVLVDPEHGEIARDFMETWQTTLWSGWRNEHDSSFVKQQMRQVLSDVFKHGKTGVWTGDKRNADAFWETVKQMHHRNVRMEIRTNG